MDTKKQIIVACPMNYHTGGVELLYQLVDTLRKHQIGDSHLFLQGKKSDFAPFPDYEKYDIDPLFIDEVQSSFSGIIIISEVMTYLIRRFPSAKKMIWWESVDNYCGGGTGALCPNFFRSVHVYGLPRASWRTIKKHYLLHTSKKAYASLREIKKEANLNLVQSQYASMFLKKNKFHPETIAPLSDYINDCYFQQTPAAADKDDIVLFNPKKGLAFTKEIISKNPSKKFVPLEGLSNQEMVTLFKKAKVYLDFGNHPGKDRMPREAAASMCCIIVGKNGSASNEVDIPIPDKYKFSTYRKNIPNISRLIDEILQNYSEKVVDFEQYRKIIKSQKEDFTNQVIAIFGNTKTAKNLKNN